MADEHDRRRQTHGARRCARAGRDRGRTLCRAAGVFKKQTRPPQFAGSAGGLAIVPCAIPPPPPPPPPIAQAIVLESASAAANPMAMSCATSFIAVPSDHFRAMKNGPAWLCVPHLEHLCPHLRGRCRPGSKFRNNFKYVSWKWWGKKDSNLRSHKTADLQSAFQCEVV
jgi:hypothetical protein